jgi:Protein of unknown function (DUF3108)
VTPNLKRAVVCPSIVLLLLLLVPASAQRKNDIVTVPFSPAPYKVGERLTFNVSFSNFISAAHVELRVVARGTFFGRDAIQLRGHVETTGFVNAALFAINNDYITYIDPETGLPFRSQQILRETSRTSDTSRDFNQPSGVATIPSKQRGEFPGTYDFVSAIYRLRALPLSEGSSYSFAVKGENQDYEAELRATGRQTIKTNVGSFNTIVTQVRVRNDSKANGYNIRIYFSDDERHVPVLVTAKLSAGEIRAELAGAEFVTPPVPKPSASPSPATQPARELPLTSVPAATAAGLEGLPFNVGEQLNYQIYLANVPQVAGTASFQVRARSRYYEHDGLLLVVRAQTTNAIQRMFFANDLISSYVDPKTLLPFRTEMDLVEGRRRLNQILTINQDYGSATTEMGEKIDIPVGTHDFVSFFYTMRTFNLTPPKRNAVSLLVNNEPKTLFITALKRERITLGSQEISAIQVSLTTDDPQSDKFQFKAWISDDSRRLPLRFSAITAIGQVRADLAIVPLVQQ